MKYLNSTTTNKRKKFYLCSSFSFDNIFSQNNKLNNYNNFSDVKNNIKYININSYPKEINYNY